MPVVRVQTARHANQQEVALVCPQCHGLFQPRKPGQLFCSAKHRVEFSREHGLQGEVASVTKLLRGVSVVIHFKGPAIEKALRLNKRQVVRVVVEP